MLGETTSLETPPITEADIKPTSKNSELRVQAPVANGQLEKKTAKIPLEKTWLEAYKRTNIEFPMAPAATDTLVGAAVVQSLADQDVTIDDFFYSQLDSKQLQEVGSVTSKVHAAFGIPLVVKSYVEGLNPEQLSNLQTITQKRVQAGMPLKTKGYSIDPEIGVGIIPEGVFRRGWGFIKERFYKAILDYIDKLPDVNLDIPRNDITTHNGSQFSMTTNNSKRIASFFSTPEYAPYVAALVKMYQSAAKVFEDPENKNLALSQRQNYNLHKGGKSEFRVTNPLQQLIGTIDSSVTNEWQEINKQTPIPEEAKNTLVDVITRRGDQPTS